MARFKIIIVFKSNSDEERRKNCTKIIQRIIEREIKKSFINAIDKVSTVWYNIIMITMPH